MILGDDVDHVFLLVMSNTRDMATWWHRRYSTYLPRYQPTCLGNNLPS